MKIKYSILNYADTQIVPSYIYLQKLFEKTMIFRSYIYLPNFFEKVLYLNGF